MIEKKRVSEICGSHFTNHVNFKLIKIISKWYFCIINGDIFVIQTSTDLPLPPEKPAERPFSGEKQREKCKMPKMEVFAGMMLASTLSEKFLSALT